MSHQSGPLLKNKDGLAHYSWLSMGPLPPQKEPSAQFHFIKHTFPGRAWPFESETQTGAFARMWQRNRYKTSLSSTGVAIIKKKDKCCQGSSKIWETGTLRHCWWDHKRHHLVTKVWQILKTLTYKPAILFLCKYSKEMKMGAHINTHESLQKHYSPQLQRENNSTTDE